MPTTTASSGNDSAIRDELLAHALRHTAASDVLDACRDIRVVQQMLGHQSMATTQIYLRRADLGRMREAMEGRDLPGGGVMPTASLAGLRPRGACKVPGRDVWDVESTWGVHMRRRLATTIAAVALVGAGCSSASTATTTTVTTVATTTTVASTTAPPTTKPAPATTRPTPTTAAPATAAPTTAPAASPGLRSPAGNLYHAGEFCPKADLNVTTTGSDGQIKCVVDGGYDRWIAA